MVTMVDLFTDTAPKATDYSAKDIEVLEGLEPVRKRPGMYIGGIDDRAYHHLATEILDNSIDEVVSGYASLISVHLAADGRLTITDNGRGIPVDPHPKYPNKSALEVITTTLHSGGKFSGKAYKVSGGLHGVGLSVVNALSADMVIEVARDKQLYRQTYSRGLPTSALENLGPISNRRGTSITFLPDTEIFGDTTHFRPASVFKMLRTKAFLVKGLEIRWSCDPELIKEGDSTPTEQVLHYPNGLKDYLDILTQNLPLLTPRPFIGRADFPDGQGFVEWAIVWPEMPFDAFLYSYCNTIPTPQGGSHEIGLRAGVTKSLRSYAEMVGNKRGNDITADDVVGTAGVMLSIFYKDPQFQGQTKDKFSSTEAIRLVENAVKDPFDHWLSADTKTANALLAHVMNQIDARKHKKKAQETARASATKRLRLPGKLADCTKKAMDGTELFIVEGDSAGGSAKQARNRETQAILPIRGKILNVASASEEKIMSNEEVNNIIEALGCGHRQNYNESALRYEKLIIMTDADVDGAHIASLLMTFFYREMPQLIANGHLYLAMPPLYRLTYGDKTAYAADDAHKDKLLATTFKGIKNVEISRFKGLGEMPPAQLKETTMNPQTRSLLRVVLPTPKTNEDEEEVVLTADIVNQLMGSNPELRFKYIQEHARFVENLDI